ncbi:hypothetical protein [Arsenophonus endosymbiont of Aleurodicus floccissimus]|uniref:hypothetical protein n=1 Tax=Arsenophonus endosymbiont of Aleurodicus floccissimus TaxID=2152761 RepID=UPI0011C3B2C5|nr:hypothetical protein [Arsenophonus endosymbiont of Aleurodicus floccissimus]
MAGNASINMTLKIIYRLLAPKDFAAKMTFLSTSSNEFSINLAIAQNADMVKATTAACQPTEVPIIKRVNGISATIKIIIEKERTKLTNPLRK